MEVKCYLKAGSGAFNEKGLVYPAIHTYSFIDKQKFAEQVERNNHVPLSSILSVLTDVGRELYKMLTLGHVVEVEGIGTFKLGISGKVNENELGRKEIEDHHLHVNFMPGSSMLKKLQETPVILVDNRIYTSNKLSTDDALTTASALIAENEFFTPAQFAEKTNVSKSYAVKVLNKLFNAGHLLRKCAGRAHVYYQVLT